MNKIQRIKALLKEGKKPLEIKKRTGASLGYIYNISTPYDYEGEKKRWMKNNHSRVNKKRRKWRMDNRIKRNKERREYYKRGKFHSPGTYRSWTSEDDNLILGGFPGTDMELAEKLISSVGAIQARRYTLTKTSVQHKRIKKE